MQFKSNTLLELLEALDATRRPERFDKFLLACEADARGRTGLEDRNYPQREYLLSMLDAINSIDVKSLLANKPSAQPNAAIKKHQLQMIEEAKKTFDNND
jgi:tRNA nucleotidyltransferase (CCA-adding enzyme)